MTSTKTALVAIGSNVGVRSAHLEFALEALHEKVARDLQRSSLYVTAPVGMVEGARPVLNAVCRFETTESAESLVSALLDIERRAGRRRHGSMGERTLDLDLLLLGNCVSDVAAATVPHPRLHRRAFVLVPACDVAPDFLHPLLGRTLRQLLHALPGEEADAVRAGRRLDSSTGALSTPQRS